MIDKPQCYCEYVNKFYPNDVLIHVPRDKASKIVKLIDKYLEVLQLKNGSKS